MYDVYDMRYITITEEFWLMLGRAFYNEDVHERQRVMHALKQMYNELSQPAEVACLHDRVLLHRHDDDAAYNRVREEWQHVKDMTSEQYDKLLQMRHNLR